MQTNKQAAEFFEGSKSHNVTNQEKKIQLLPVNFCQFNLFFNTQKAVYT